MSNATRTQPHTATAETRHTYAQRHADAGTPPDVLRDLLGHEHIGTTQTYYRVTEKRIRAAIDKVVAFQFDRHGNRIWPAAKALLDHEHARLRVGAVAVPFGTCSEPSNVKAGGGARPFRFRCLGCGHFRTDPSYLPELRDYLHTLLRNQERVRSATELDDWATAEATPSTEEINRLRALIQRTEQAVDDLTDDDRAALHDATSALRKVRQVVNLGMPGTAPPRTDPRLERGT
ncbi:site-specific integrase [Saccharopolyspora sp. K220]|uniref:tyrosine-type recombinase/integrase n=1 Tax=Saccharopolyspora soli TaxID=2926618 RepID=UPI001F58E19F|nr:tyrosine-type recombinase/integrase [Saccharopolyspora soli]MCI2422876.1 site-specific integrase [Saccharopolyspora soli]